MQQAVAKWVVSRALQASCLGLALFFTSTSQAREPTAAPAPAPASLQDSLTGEALEAYQGARLLFEDGDYQGAYAKFKRARELSGDPRLLWNMAVCQKELRHYAQTSALIELYLVEGGERLPAESRSNATETLTALRSFYSKVTILGAPSGARILVDAVEIGRAPLKDPVPLDLGARKLRVEQSGFEPFERTVDVPGSTDLAVTVSLKPEATGRLFVTTSSAKSTIIVDGRVVGSGRWEGTLRPGEHVVRVTAAGKKPYESHVPIAAKGNRTLDVTLVDESQSPLWPWIVGGAAVVAGAAVGGYFLFRGDPEPGAVPTGQLETLYLPEAFRR